MQFISMETEMWFCGVYYLSVFSWGHQTEVQVNVWLDNLIFDVWKCYSSKWVNIATAILTVLSVKKKGNALE